MMLPFAFSPLSLCRRAAIPMRCLAMLMIFAAAMMPLSCATHASCHASSYREPSSSFAMKDVCYDIADASSPPRQLR